MAVWSRRLSWVRWGTTPREEGAMKAGVSIWTLRQTSLPRRGPAAAALDGSRRKENMSERVAVVGPMVGWRGSTAVVQCSEGITRT